MPIDDVPDHKWASLHIVRVAMATAIPIATAVLHPPIVLAAHRPLLVLVGLFMRRPECEPQPRCAEFLAGSLADRDSALVGVLVAAAGPNPFDDFPVVVGKFPFRRSAGLVPASAFARSPVPVYRVL